MSNSDKEFDEWFSEQNPWFIDPKGVVEKAWNHHYPYKERCETLEAKVKELEEKRDSLFVVIKHGDRPHQDWLREVIYNHFADEAMPEYVPSNRDKKIQALEAKVKDYESGHRGACFTCEPVGELNQKLEAHLLEACKYLKSYNSNTQYYKEELAGSWWAVLKLSESYLNKPEIKNLLNKEGNTGGTMTKPVNKRAIELFNRIYKTAPEIAYRRIEGLIDEMEVLNSKVKEHEGNYPKFTALENVEMSEKIEALESKVKELEEFIGEVVVCSQLDRESSKFYEFLELEIFDKSKKLLEGVKSEW